MSFSMISAHDKNFGIGYKNTIPWYIPEDFKWFKEKTINHIVIMGMNTYFSLPEKFRPLPNRLNYVLCDDPYKIKIIQDEGAFVFSNIIDLLDHFNNVDEEIFIMGGASIYQQFYNKCDKLYLTEIDAEFECDTFFPTVNYEKWENIFKSDIKIDDKSNIKFTFNIYKLKN